MSTIISEILADVSDLVGLLGGLLGSVAVFYLLKANKAKIEKEGNNEDAERYEKMVNAYEKRIDSLASRMEKLECRVRELEAKVLDKDEIIAILRRQIIEEFDGTPEA